jgi:hypothetical protein
MLDWVMPAPAAVMVWLTGLGAPQTMALPGPLLPPFALSAALLRTILKRRFHLYSEVEHY